MICAQYASTLSQTELTLTESENHDESETVCCFALCGVIHSFSPLTGSESAVDSCMMSLDLWISGSATVTALSPHKSAGSFTDPRPLSQTITSGSQGQRVL